MSEQRNLTEAEIKSLSTHGCEADDWKQVLVYKDFNPDKLRNVSFKGSVSIGKNDAKDATIKNAIIKNCQLGNNVSINHIGRMIDNYIIGNNVIINSVGCISSDDKATYGNGVQAKVMVENGGREVVLYQTLTAQTAYFQSFFIEQEKFTKKFAQVIAHEIDRFSATHGTIEDDAEICDCQIIANSKIGAKAKVLGCREIKNSTINGHAGSGSTIRDSIITENGFVGIDCIIEKCFVANGAVIDEGFSAIDSLFFANCECLRGEACSAFLGPFTVTHHKSTLLLAGIYSFYNAGSGTNFSNHRYKLGPLHQGIMERGCKNGSGSYLLWPCHIAPFTNVIGRHQTTCNTSEFPYSLLIEQNNKNMLLPGANVFAAGTERDMDKWPKRDKRTDSSMDVINFQGINPMIIGRVFQALPILQTLVDAKENIKFKGAEIPCGYLSKSLARYHALINFYYGGILAKNLENNSTIPSEENKIPDEWLDIGGMLAPKKKVMAIINNIEEDKYNNYTSLIKDIKQLGENYKQNEWEWFISCLRSRGKKPGKELFTSILQNWQEAAKLRAEMIYRDANKEFAESMMIGYGLYGENTTEYAKIHGEVSENDFVKGAVLELQQIENRASKLLSSLD